MRIIFRVDCQLGDRVYQQGQEADLPDDLAALALKLRRADVLAEPADPPPAVPVADGTGGGTSAPSPAVPGADGAGGGTPGT